MVIVILWWQARQAQEGAGACRGEAPAHHRPPDENGMARFGPIVDTRAAPCQMQARAASSSVGRTPYYCVGGCVVLIMFDKHSRHPCTPSARPRFCALVAFFRGGQTRTDGAEHFVYIGRITSDLFPASVHVHRSHSVASRTSAGEIHGDSWWPRRHPPKASQV